jgi:hypothetical protein
MVPGFRGLRRSTLGLLPPAFQAEKPRTRQKRKAAQARDAIRIAWISGASGGFFLRCQVEWRASMRTYMR